ncbi:cytochrome c oxidase assembly protein [Reyranella sp.]|uniref:cytochrome c oxidase assembly protein n=1 Tax=Reyranella sp. TaxID=1929291 RepID=UPI003BACB314
MDAILAGLGHLSTAMGAHILLMNLLAPAAALWMTRASLPFPAGVSDPLAPTIVQLLLLWGWHTPPVLTAAMESPALHLTMQLSLMASAVWFWRTIVGAAASCPWRAIAALLITSKLFCLLGVLLTFATRAIYPAMTHHTGAAFDPLADQQLAGLMMLIACPLSYLVAAVVVATRWLTRSELATQQDEGARIA